MGKGRVKFEVLNLGREFYLTVGYRSLFRGMILAEGINWEVNIQVALML